ncbi:glutaredoxin-related protein [Fragilariopsis cylindrus CCMP1102]|uniref:Glutaredoxin n=1 Tax=Fragilariopsis cylindrus CCMP1102 TaxID=635003 RepID=A0A1E7F3G5_9STRA|nr:glutaredoxin-related protein [Fragilariopsis cylindrus CCMP1102]|eukprot:OEU12687.1 glutaredoxin-related protein [Fragilariopsis cylindrus CCMP1102]
MIKQHVTENPVMLYMKGNPSMPQCGFSAKIVQALQAEGVDFSSVNVLDYPSIRDGIKKYSEWPTIPQLYVNGEFIGGCDIVSQMSESGELKEILADVVKVDAKE